MIGSMAQASWTPAGNEGEGRLAERATLGVVQNEVRDDRDHDQYQDQRSTGEQVVITRVALILARCQEHQ